jgi:hypothetical protein
VAFYRRKIAGVSGQDPAGDGPFVSLSFGDGDDEEDLPLPQ